MIVNMPFVITSPRHRMATCITVVFLLLCYGTAHAWFEQQTETDSYRRPSPPVTSDPLPAVTRSAVVPTVTTRRQSKTRQSLTTPPGTPITADGCGSDIQRIGNIPQHDSGFGEQVPLGLALAMIKPGAWRLQLGDIDTQRPVSWSATDDWVKTLASILSPDHCATVDANTQTLHITARVIPAAAARYSARVVGQTTALPGTQPGNHAARPATMAAEKSTAVTGNAQRRSARLSQQSAIADSKSSPSVAPATPAMPRQQGSNTIKKQPPSSPARIKVWRLDKGNTLRDTLHRWSNIAGWQLVWEPDNDYRIDARSSYVGDYQQAVENLVEDLAHSGLPLGADLYTGNRVLRIRRVR